MSKYFPSPLPCELYPYGTACKVPAEQRSECKMKKPENEEFIDWRATHTWAGMTIQELMKKQY